jgi:hypothetical protein
MSSTTTTPSRDSDEYGDYSRANELLWPTYSSVGRPTNACKNYVITGWYLAVNTGANIPGGEVTGAKYDKWLDWIVNMVDDEPLIKGLLAKLERGGNSNRLHIQMAVCLTKKLRYNTVKKLLGLARQTWMATMRGNWNQNRAYVLKDETAVIRNGTYSLPLVPDVDFVDYGTGSAVNGTAKDLDVLVPLKLANDDQGILDYCEENPSAIRHLGHLDRLAQLKEMAMLAQPREQPKMLVLGGAGNTGKSYKANSLCDDWSKKFWVGVDDGKVKWHDGLKPEHEYYLLDDFHPGNLTIRHLKTAVSPYPLRLNRKGGHVMFRCRYLVISTNHGVYLTQNSATGAVQVMVDFKVWFPKTYKPADDIAIRRRLTTVEFRARDDQDDVWTWEAQRPDGAVFLETPQVPEWCFNARDPDATAPESLPTPVWKVESGIMVLDSLRSNRTGGGGLGPAGPSSGWGEASSFMSYPSVTPPPSGTTVDLARRMVLAPNPTPEGVPVCQVPLGNNGPSGTVSSPILISDDGQPPIITVPRSHPFNPRGPTTLRERGRAGAFVDPDRLLMSVQMDEETPRSSSTEPTQPHSE